VKFSSFLQIVRPRRIVVLSVVLGYNLSLSNPFHINIIFVIILP